MQIVPTLAAAGLIAAAFSSRQSERPPSDEDSLLWRAIVSGDDVLLGASFRESVLCHPLRIESLVTQRVFRPFLLLCARLVRPWASVEDLDGELRDAWCRRNRSLRISGSISVRSLAGSDASSWRQNSRLLVDTMSLPTDETGRVKAVMASRRPDIHRAFSECCSILDEASCVEGSDSFGWLMLKSVVEDMEAVILKIVDSQVLEGGADIGPDVGLALPATEPPKDVSDRFGAVSLDGESGVFQDSFGYHGVHEEFIVSGHRAPSVGLSQYRRMGGRVFG